MARYWNCTNRNIRQLISVVEALHVVAVNLDVSRTDLEGVSVAILSTDNPSHVLVPLLGTRPPPNVYQSSCASTCCTHECNWKERDFDSHHWERAYVADRRRGAVRSSCAVHWYVPFHHSVAEAARRDACAMIMSVLTVPGTYARIQYSLSINRSPPRE
eukprot:SAG31_NODE_1591_length_7814_cov_4.501453_4_plen_159_part_00